MQIFLKQSEVWFITGSQHLYGEETLKNVAAHSLEVAEFLNVQSEIPVTIQFQEIVTTSDEISSVLKRASKEDNCIGVIIWMHTFSPAKMWIDGLKNLYKPLLHLHTQFNDAIPWSQIDMDFMNENQSAHGDRELGYMLTRMRKNRKIVVGHWKDKDVTDRIAVWTRAAAGWQAFNTTKIARIGDNMRQVAVTEGDKVEAQYRFGLSVNGYGIGDVARFINEVTEDQISTLTSEYDELYAMEDTTRKSRSLRDAAKIELGLRTFLTKGGFHGFTDTFEDLHGFAQLPGIAVQRLMADGFGFGAEGDWKIAGLLHAIKVMDKGIPGGSSFMEDYTYNFNGKNSSVLGAHMLEICPSIASGKPSCEVHPLGIGGKDDPARLVFDVDSGPAINISLVDMGNRFRLVVNEVTVEKPKNELPKLPVARVLWNPKPDLSTSAAAWMLAGGSHHTVFSKSVTTEFVEDFAEMAGIELVIIDENTTVRNHKNELKWNEVYYHLFQNNL